MKGKMPAELQKLFEKLKERKIQVEDPMGSLFSHTYSTTVGAEFGSIISEIEKWIMTNYETTESGLEPSMRFFKD